MEQAAVFFEDGWERLNAFVQANSEQKFCFLVDENTHEFCLPLLLSELPDIESPEIIEVPAGEDAKSPEVAQQIWESLSELSADRSSVIVNCGGGVVTDLGGFIAATFKRGIRFINVPTSLLAMVDASVGGKTGINLGHIKNQIGTFTQPELVYINPAFLKTLPDNEMLSGFAEMLKHGLILDRKLWDDLARLDSLSAENLTPFIQRAGEIKKAVVEEDPNEKGLRKILNAGHTLGHAVESWYLDAAMDITHGEAVAIGLVLESFISWQKDILTQEDFDEFFEGIQKFYPKKQLPEVSALLNYLQHDKKNSGRKIHAVLLSAIGECPSETIEITPEEIQQAIKYYTANYSD